MLKIAIRLDIDKDLSNRVIGSNKISHGKRWTDGLPPQYQELSSMLVGKTVNESIFFKNSLQQLYQEKEKQLVFYKGEAEKYLIQHNGAIEKILLETTGKELPITTLTLNLTTFPRCPYNIETNEIWIYAFDDPQNIIGILLHELQHFIVIHYFKNQSPLNQASNEEFEFIKESLTVILNDYYPQYLFRKELGYPKHQQLREQLCNQRKSTKNFQSLIQYAFDWIRQNKGTIA